VSDPARGDAVFATTRAGEAALRARAPATAQIVVQESSTLRFAELLSMLHAQGSRLVLTEGGPTLFGELLAERLVDELFVTSSPALFGRYPNDQRKSLVDGRNLGGASLELLSVRRHGSHLFCRYALDRT
jgi:riboflavin biosynthesis pyrimidine reductase